MRKDPFDKKYPLFSKYFKFPEVRANMLENTELERKYKEYNEIITSFIEELDKRFDVNTVKDLIIEAIIKLPENMLVSLITSYLNSNEVAKNNADFIVYYKKTSNLGSEAVLYIENNGLITNRTYKDIPAKAVDLKYKTIKTGEESFKGIKLDLIYDTLIYSQKRFVVSLIESGILEKFDEMFARTDFNFITIINFLMNYHIDANILNSEVYENIGAYYLMLLVCLIIDNEDTIGAVEPIKKICENRRFLLLKDIIANNLLLALSNISYEDIEEKTYEEAIEILKSKELVLKKKEN